MTDQTNKDLPPLVGVLAALPERTREVIEAYGAACARTAIANQKKHAAQSASAPASGSAPSDVDKKRIAHNAHVQCSLIPGATFYNAAEAAIDALLAQYGNPAWQPIETAPMPKIGHTGYGERTLLAVDCGPGTLPSVKIGWWSGHEWASDTGFASLPSLGYRVTHWMPLPPAPQEGK